MKTPAELTELFRQRGLKVTPQRQRIFQVLSDNRAHPTAESVYHVVRHELPTISLKTVYQTLKELVAIGEVQHLELGTGAGRFDPNTALHHHLVCTGCGRVRDIHADFSHLQVPADERHGFSVRSTEVIFRGLCDACADG